MTRRRGIAAGVSAENLSISAENVSICNKLTKYLNPEMAEMPRSVKPALQLGSQASVTISSLAKCAAHCHLVCNSSAGLWPALIQ